MAGNVSILVDDRTGSRELFPYITAHTHRPIELVRLSYGDVSFLGCGESGRPVSVGIERKTITDLLDSIQTGRLSGHQLLGLINSYEYVYLLVEGLWRADDEGVLTTWRRGGWAPVELGSRRFMAREVERFLNTIMVMCGVMVWRTESLPQSGRWISELHAWWSKPWGKHRGHQQFVTRRERVSLRRPTLVERVAKELPGVGWERARAIGQCFPSVQALVNATAKELAQVEGVGKKTAKAIVQGVCGVS